MGRELRRVPADFDQPVGKGWQGFLNPHYVVCSACNGDGSTRSLLALGTLVDRILLAGTNSTERPPDFAGRPVLLPNYKGAPSHHRHHWPHPYLIEAGVSDPGDTLHEVSSGLAGRSGDRPFGHDACDRWSATKKIVEAAGLPEDWGTCAGCGGDGTDPDSRSAYEAWTPTEPPEGDAYQIWETVSDGSPVSPPFKQPEDLARWMVDNDTSVTKDTTYEQWMSFISGPGWAPSLVMDERGLRVGVQMDS